MRGFKTVKVYS